MSFGKAIHKPARVHLVNLDNTASIECLINPTVLTEKIGVQWNRKVVPGLPFQVLQYQSTANSKINGLEFHLNKILASEREGNTDILTFREFLRVLTVPAAEGSAPPRVFVVWPKVLTVEAVVTSVEFRYQKFAADGSALLYTAACSFEEATVIRNIKR